MTNPERDELLKQADTITGHVAALANEPLRMPLTTWNVVSNDILAAAESLRRLASSDGGVKVKPLVWRDHRPDSFPEPAWSAQTSFGFYNIEEVSASDSPVYVVRLHAHHFVADKDSLDDAKAAAQADYEARIKSTLVEVPAAAGMREALEQINAHWSEPFVVRSIVRKALTAPGATTKSDGGAKAGSSPILASKEDQRSDTHGMMPVGDNAANVGSTGVGPSDPSSTRSEVTVEFGELVDDLLSVTAEVRRQNWKNGGAHLYDDEDAARKITRALLDQFEIRRK